MFPNTFAIITWNVLHRVHAVNWKEPCIAAFPEERHRVTGIASRVAEWLAEEIDAVCMQEVSGDQRAALRAALPADVLIFEHVYPRLPRLRRTDCATLADARERLVVATRIPTARLASEHTFAKDPGKGYLAIDLDEHVRLVDTHVSFGDRAAAQLARLREAASGPQRVVVVGDYNAPAAKVLAAFGDDFTISSLTEPTRGAHGEHGGSVIDHVVTRGARIASATVLDGRALSDHAPVHALIELQR